jgi:hypothetical protein
LNLQDLDELVVGLDPNLPMPITIGEYLDLRERLRQAEKDRDSNGAAASIHAKEHRKARERLALAEAVIEAASAVRMLDWTTDEATFQRLHAALTEYRAATGGKSSE